MTPADLATAGTALYGKWWQSELARALGVASRTVRRWAAGDNAIPEGVRQEIVALLRERRMVIDKAMGNCSLTRATA